MTGIQGPGPIPGMDGAKWGSPPTDDMSEMLTWTRTAVQEIIYDQKSATYPPNSTGMYYNLGALQTTLAFFSGIGISATDPLYLAVSSATALCQNIVQYDSWDQVNNAIPGLPNLLQGDMITISNGVLSVTPSQFNQGIMMAMRSFMQTIQTDINTSNPNIASASQQLYGCLSVLTQQPPISGDPLLGQLQAALNAAVNQQTTPNWDNSLWQLGGIAQEIYNEYAAAMPD